MILLQYLVLTACRAVWGESPKISEATILLPSDPGAVFTLSGENGCFSFSTDRDDLLLLLSEAGDCATFVKISMNPQYGESLEGAVPRAIVFAKERKSGFELRSEVYVSVVSRLELVTRIRRLAVGEVEGIQIQGFDRVGNTFSTLEGMEFVWEISTEPTFPLKNVPLKTAEYSLSEARLKLEEAGKQTDLFLVKGQVPGKGLLSASYKGQISSLAVKFSVIESFRVIPPSIGLVFCGEAQLAIETVRGKEMISLPNAAYSFGIPAVARSNLVIKNDGKIVSLTSEPAQVTASITDLRTADENEQTVRICIGQISALHVKTESLYPVIGSEITVRLSASSARDCPHVSELTLSDNIKSAFIFSEFDENSFEVKKSENPHERKIFVYGPPGRLIRISGTVFNSSADDRPDCQYSPNISTEGAAIEIKSVEPISLPTDVVVLPASEKEAFLPLKGGSGQYIAGDALTISPAGEVRIGESVEGSFTVKDLKNVKNFATVEIFRKSITTNDFFFSLSSNESSINTFIGYALPFEEYLVPSPPLLLYNCSSLVNSSLVKIADEAIAQVSLRSSSVPYTCGKLVIVPRRPGKSWISVGDKLTVELTVFSAFKIKPAHPIYGPHALIALNGSWTFSVEGGSLSSLRSGEEEVVVLSHPWVADIVTNRSKNEFRIICRMPGKSSAHVVHTSSGGIDFECIEKVEKIGVIADSRATVNSTIFVTCGHKEFFSLWTVGLDKAGRKLDNVTWPADEGVSWSLPAQRDEKISVAPMTCGSEKIFTASAGRGLNNTVLVKARDTVRAAGVSPDLSKSVLYLPCTERKKVLGIALLGGSGEYMLTNAQAELVRVRNHSDMIIIGGGGEETSSSILAAKINPSNCSTLIEFSVSDSKIPDTSLDLSLNLVQVTSVHVSIPLAEPWAFVVQNEWTNIQIAVKFEDGKIIDSPKWFAVTESLFRWKCEGAEFRIGANSIQIRVSGVPGDKKIVIFSSGNKIFRNPVSLQVSLIGSLTFSPGNGVNANDTEWRLASRAEIAARGVFSPEIDYSFASSDLHVEPTSYSSVAVSALAGSTGKKSSNVTLTATAKSSKRIVFVWTQLVKKVSTPVSVRLRSFSVLVNSTATISLQGVDENGDLIYPPTQLQECDIKWSLYGSLPGQTLQYTFTQLGDVPVKAYVYCPTGLARTQETSAVISVFPDDVKIKPLAHLMAGGIYPSLPSAWQPGPGAERTRRIEISESEIGTVLFSPKIAHAMIHRTETHHQSVVLGGKKGVVIARIVLLNEVGQEVLFPSNFVDRISLGSHRPSLIDVELDSNGHILARGIMSGCASIFALFDHTIIAGTFSVCVVYPVVPAAGEKGMVVNVNAEVQLRYADDLSRIFVRGGTNLLAAIDFIDTIKPWKIGCDVVLKNMTVVESFVESAQIGWDKLSWLAPLTNSTKFTPFKSDTFLFNGIKVKFDVEPVKDLMLARGNVTASLVHKQSSEDFILWFYPVSETGKNFTASPFIDQKFHHICQVDNQAVEVFSVAPVVVPGGNKHLLGCKFTAIINRHSTRASSPAFLDLNVMMGSLLKKFQIQVDYSHFHLVLGPFEVAAPATIHSSMSETVTLRLVNLPDSMRLSDCFVQIVGNRDYIAVSPFNASGHFEVTRTSPRGPHRVHITTFCDSQSIDTNIEFFDLSSKIKPGDAYQHYVSSPLYDHAIATFSWIAKILASIAVVAAVAFLYRKQIITSHEKKTPKRVSITPLFSPHPHHEEDTFITDHPPRRRTATRWSSFAEE